MFTYEGISRRPAAFRSLTGFCVRESDDLYKEIESRYEAAERKRLYLPGRKRAPGAGRKFRKPLRERLLMALIWMQISFGSPEQGLMAVAMAQMAQHYGLPSYINVGIGDSKLVDAQSGLERGMTLLMGALAGADTFGHMGIAGADQVASLEQLIIDNQMAAYVKRILRDFAVNQDTLALEAIKRVGIGGNFLADEHTVAHFRKELWLTDAFDRRDWQSWWEDGAKSMVDWAREQKEIILAHHEPEPLDPQLVREIDRIVAGATKELVET